MNKDHFEEDLFEFSSKNCAFSIPKPESPGCFRLHPYISVEGKREGEHIHGFNVPLR